MNRSDQSILRSMYGSFKTPQQHIHDQCQSYECWFRTDEMPKIVPGQEFNSLADFKSCLRAWAVEDGFSPSILDSDARRVRVGCR